MTVTSIDGFMLRQGDNYTHGSSSSVYVTPSEATAYPSLLDAKTGTFGAVVIRARFSSTTNAINNAPIGIVWSGRIDFGSRA